MYKKSEWGKKIGIYNTAMALGTGLGAVLFASMASKMGWRSAFYLIGVISLVLTGLSMLLPDVKKQTDQATGGAGENKVSIKASLTVILKNKTLVYLCLGAGIGVMVLQAVMAWTSIYLVRIMSMSIEAAAGILGASALMAAIGYPIGGAILDKWYKKDKRARVWMPAICFIGCALCYLIGFYWQNLVLIIAGQLVYCLCGTCFHTATQELVPAWFKSISYGFYVMFCQLFGVVGPVTIGLLSESFGLVAALLIMQAFFLVAVVFLVLAGGQYMRDYHKARAAEGTAGCEACPK